MMIYSKILHTRYFPPYYLMRNKQMLKKYADRGASIIKASSKGRWSQKGTWPISGITQFNSL